MAGGSSSRKEGGRLDNARLRQCHQRYRHHHPSSNIAQESPHSECFKRRQKIEYERTYLQSVQRLQRDILRIFTKCRHSDFYIIHGCNVVKTNDCIVRTRSPQLYKTLETYFVHSNNIIKCYIETPEIFQRIKDFSRLLYSNLDVEHEERILIEFIATVKHNLEHEDSSCADYTYSPKDRTCEDILYSNFDLVDRTIAKKEDGADDLSPSTSDMADSGLETGSVSPLENTESENSGTDLEESHATEYVSMDDDFIKISLNGEVEKSRDKKCIAISSCSPSTSEDRHNGKQEYEDSVKSGVTRIPRNSRDIEAAAGCSSHLKHEQRDSNAYHGCTGMAETIRESKDGEETISRSNESFDKVARYEAIYDESDGGSNDNESTNLFVPTESFEFVDPTIMSPTTSDPRRNANHYDSFNKIADEKLCPNPEARSMTVEELRHELSHSNDPTLKKSSSSISSYYFIDASSLNDEEEMASLGNLMSKEMRDSHGNLMIYTSTTGNYVPTRTPCNAIQDEQNHKLTTRKLSSLQGGHERVAEFERELKMTEYLKPMAEPRKVKRVDSISEDKSEAGSDKGIEKEALVVEIKEADSGESTHPSPCSDNNTNVKETNVVSKDVTNVDKSASVREIDDPARRPSLIRRNTFELDPNDEKLSVLRQEYERRQGHLLFQSSIPQYSGHRVDGDSCFEPPNEKSSAPVVAEVITQFSVDLPQTGVTYSTITYMTTSDHHHQDIPKTLITTDQEVSVKNDITATKFATTSLLLLGDPKEQSKVKNAEVPMSIASRKNEANFTTGQFLSSRESPEEMISWASEKDSSARSITNDQDDYPMSKSSSGKLLIDSCSESDDGSRTYCNSLPVTLNCELPRERRLSLSSSKRPKRDETAPIISGGMCTVDYSKPTDSPIVHRKTESTPIVSGGSVMMTEPRERIKPTRMASSMSAWVVDMSDCGKNGTGNRTSNIGNCQTTMSQSFSSSDCVNSKNGRKAKASEAKCSSLGFFVNLKDIDTPKEKHENPSQEVKKPVIIEPAKQACEFFIDISDENKTEKNDNVEVPVGNSKVRTLGESGDRKNIFSMFIDLKESNDKQHEETRVSGSRLFDKRGDARQPNKLQGLDSESSSSSQMEQSGQDQTSNGSSGERGKPSVFMFIESDSPVVRRRALSSSRPAFQRHSWNVEKTQLQGNGNGQLTKDSVVRREHKRAHSVSVDRADLRKLQTKSSNSSHSLSEVARADTLNGIVPRRYNELESSRNTDTSTEEVFEYDVRDTPPNSHVETGENEDIRGCIKQRDYKEPGTTELPTTTEIPDTRIYEDECSEVSGWDKTRTESTEGHTRKSETFDISSGSGPSPESDNHDFDLDDLRTGEMANYNEILQVEHPVTSKVSETHKSLTETIKKIECELKKPEYGEYERTSSDSLTPVSRKDTKSSSRGSKEGQTKATGSSFVRLSDLDKTPSRSRASDVASREDRTIYRMSNSIPETSWVESKLAVNRANGPVRALPRKFGAIMSTSLPAKHKSPIEDVEGEGEGIISESDLSSMQSSMGRSGGDVSTEETETSSVGVTKPYNRLGEDLLRMFLEEINPDVTIDVGGRKIQAHKCILSSRCQYFAAILSGGWIESAGNVISLQGYSYSAVHFALCHIYSGESNIPDTLSIVELATLADMLCLEGLKEVIGYTLKVKYCHLFHKPCQLCAVGVLECMPLAAAYGLDEVYRKSLRWITRHFVRIWPCKAFATLPRELMDKCYHQHIVHMSPDNVLQTMMDCDKLLATLPNVRWAEPVFRMVSNLLETAVKYISDNFSSVLGNENFQALGRDLTWNISRLEDNFLAAADRLPPDQACKSYSKLNKMLVATQVEEPQAKPPWGPLFIEFLRKIQSRVEKCLVKEASRAARTTTWLKMDLELRRRIQELACLVILPHEALKRPSRHSNFLKEPRVPSARTPASRSLDLRRVKMAITDHDKTTKSATAVTTTTSAPSTTQQIKKPLLVKPKSDPLERKIPQEEKQVATDSVALRPKSWPNKLEVKSRYLEPRNKSVTKEIGQLPQHERVIVQQRRKIMISSSDSSRTSSPAMKRAVDKKPLAKMKLTIKKDVKALSSDSLAEPTSSRVTTKKEPISKSCGITRPESPSLKQKDADIGLSADSLAEPKRKQQQPITKKKQPGKMDTSMSADSLMAEIGTAPKSSNVSNKVSPTMGRVGTTSKTQVYDRVKKSSPPVQQKSPLTVGRKLPRSLECSTAASRNRAAAISAYHGSPNLRRNLLDAAKTPDVPAKTLNGVSSKSSPRQQSLSSSVVSATSSIAKKEKREPLSNQPSTESPSKRSSPKSNGTHRTNRLTSTAAKRPVKGIEDRAKTKCHNGDAPKQPTVGSRSGTFLKDEPTILKKSDIKTVQISDA